jgi:steroid delta-isomerase-like uncharacterized protein
MSEQENKALVSAFFRDVLGMGETSKIAEYVTDDYQLHLSGQSQALDAAGHGFMVEQLRAAFPDWKETVVEQIAEGDRVVTRVLGTGTHQASYNGIPATGRRIELNSINIDRIANGRIAERWLLADMYSALQQIGVLPGAN